MSKHAFLHFRPLAALSLLVFVCTANAQDGFFPNDAILDAGNPVAGNAYIGYANFDDYLHGVNGTSPTVTMITGGSVDFDVLTFNGSVFNMNDGTVGASWGSLKAFHQSTINMSGGLVGQHVTTQNQSTFNLHGGLVFDDFTTLDTTSLTMNGGSIGHSLLINMLSTVAMWGGSVVADIFVQDAGTLTMFGNDLTKTLTDPNFQGFYSQWTLTGHLADNTDVTGRTVLVQNGSGATFNLSPVPEPSSLLVVGGLALGVLRRRRKWGSYKCSSLPSITRHAIGESRMSARILKKANPAAILVAAITVVFAIGAMAQPLRMTHSRAVTNAEIPSATGSEVAASSFFRAAAHGGGFTVLPSVSGETVTVTTLDDVTDFSGSQQVSNLPGPDGRVSFREAVTAANNTPGPQTIAFAIPTAEFWLFSDMALLRLELGAFFLNDSETTVDFTTQTVNIGNTNPDGPEVGIYGLESNGWGIAAIFINGDNCVIKGLGGVYQRGYAVRMVGNNNRVIGCQIRGPFNAAVAVEGYMGSPAPTGNIVGGTAPGEGNTLVGVVIGGPSDGNIVIGNTVIGGVDVQGATQYGVFARNNRIGGPTAAERNVISGAGYIGEEGYPVGSQVRVIDADGTLVEGNYIGTTADGMSAYSPQYGPIGVEVRDARGTTIRGNLIAGMRVVGTNHYAGQVFGQAILVDAINANTDATLIQGNRIGLAADGVTPIVTHSGITVSPMISVRHAFNTRIASNHIARVETTGVVVGSQENGITITGNSIHDCGGLGIDLFYGNFGGTGGVTLNDPGDGDEGGNGLQNFPVLLSAETNGSSIALAGTLDTSPSAEFTIEFFSSPSGDPSGNGEGAVFLGSTSVTTDGAGHAGFSLTLPANVAVGEVVTATATRVSTGDTSEFSVWIVITSGELFVAPDSFSVIWGTRLQGSLESLAASDDVRMNIAGSVTGPRGAPNVQVELSGISPLSLPDQLTVKLEAQSDLFPSGQVSQRIELFNFVTQQWVQVDQRFATTVDSVATYSVTSNAERFVEPGTKRMRARLTWFGGSQLSRTQGSKIDQCSWWVR